MDLPKNPSSRQITRGADLIKQTRNIIKGMSRKQRLNKAQRHFWDALLYRQARNDPDINKSPFFQFAYRFQQSRLTSWTLFVFSFIYMYLIIWEPNNRMDLGVPLSPTIVILQTLILISFWLEAILEVVQKQQWRANFSKRYPFKFWAKIVILALLTIDEIIYYSLYKTYPVRLFRILRAFLPYFYQAFCRKALESLLAAYKDILVYLIFYSMLIFAFAVIATQFISIPPDFKVDEYSSNYDDLGKMTFLIYVLASYDAWPDYEEKAVDISKWLYIYFVAFIFLNCFYFVTIPTTVIFASFKSSRSKILLIDEIKQQNSLLLCFVCLGEKDLVITTTNFHQFMLHLYKYKIRLVDNIKELSYQMESNSSGEIYISDFMRLTKIIEEDPSMMPPQFHDWQLFIRFRKWLKKKLHIRKIANSNIFEMAMIVVIFINFVLVMISFFGDLPGYLTIEIVFLSVYTIEFIIRFFGEGPEKYCTNPGNLLDAALLIMSIVMIFYSNEQTAVTLRKLARLIRLVRITRVAKILIRNEFFRTKIYLNSIYKKLRVMFGQLYICVIVGLKVFPLFTSAYYIIGIIGMEAYDNRFVDIKSSPYSLYDGYSNFRSFIESQLVVVQVMIEAGWSPIVFDYSYRYGHFGVVCLYFVSIHIVIVIILVSLMKGMAADLYQTIFNSYNEVLNQELQQVQQEQIQRKDREQIQQIKDIIEKGQKLPLDTIRKKQIVEAKYDKEMMIKLKQLIFKSSQQLEHKSDINGHTQRKKKNSRMYLLESATKERVRSNSPLKSRQMAEKLPRVNVERIDSADVMLKNHSIEMLNIEQPEASQARKSDRLLDEYMWESSAIQDAILEHISIQNDADQIADAPIYPRFLLQFLDKKLERVKNRYASQMALKFQMNNQMIRSGYSLTFYKNIMEQQLGIQKPEEQRKLDLKKDIMTLSVSDTSSIEKRIKKKYKKKKIVMVDPVLRKVFLNNTNDELIQKFEIEYFSDIYGNSFKQMNMVALNPMLRLESLLIYNMAKLLRYPEIGVFDFFNILASIEYKISNTLVKKGSIFKFVFEVEELGSNWFAVEVKENKQIHLHFLKTGVWLTHKNMVDDEIYYARDIFYYDQADYSSFDTGKCQKTIKLLYKAFESLGFSMLNETNFFNADPAEYVYDLYTFITSNPAVQLPEEEAKPFSSENFLKAPQEPKKTSLKVSKVMLVILSKENERPENLALPYDLTKLRNLLDNSKKKKLDENFKFDENEGQTYEKLKNFTSDDAEKIIETEGLPYAFIIDMITSIQNILKLHKEHLLNKVEYVLNDEFMKLEI